MATRTDLPRVNGDTPTIFNHFASAGGLLAGAAGVAIAKMAGWGGLALGVATTAPALAAPLVASAGFGLLGSLVGGYIGKHIMEREAIEGREVSPPSFLNRGLVNGLFAGAAVVLAMAALPAILTAAGLASAATPFFGLPTVVGCIAGMLPTVAAIEVQSRQTKEYANAVTLADIREVTVAGERAREKGLEQYLKAPTPTAQPAAEAPTRRNGKSWAETVDASRAPALQEASR